MLIRTVILFWLWPSCLSKLSHTYLVVDNDDGSFHELPDLKVVFYDYDHTTARTAFGAAVIHQCQSAEHHGGSCKFKGKTSDDDYNGELVKSLGEMPTDTLDKAFGGEDGLQRLKEHFDRLNGRHVETYMLSASWAPISAQEYGDFLYSYFNKIGLNDERERMPRENIITVGDPGADIPAQKGEALEKKLQELNAKGFTVTKDECLFNDDAGYYLAQGKELCGLQKVTRDENGVPNGLTDAQLTFIEQRAGFVRQASASHRVNSCFSMMIASIVVLFVYLV